ncbi:MAG: hypothetical protein ABH814_00885 [bacterium]
MREKRRSVMLTFFAFALAGFVSLYVSFENSCESRRISQMNEPRLAGRAFAHLIAFVLFGLAGVGCLTGAALILIL